jgi:hypothetical protein
MRQRYDPPTPTQQRGVLLGRGRRHLPSNGQQGRGKPFGECAYLGGSLISQVTRRACSTRLRVWQANSPACW